MNEILQELLGDNWEIIFGGSSGLMGIISYLAFRWLKNKSVNTAITTVTGFFTKDMTAEETTDFGNILKSFASRKSLRILNNLVVQLEKFDTVQIKGYIQDGMMVVNAILSVMIKNGAFDGDLILKDKLQSITDRYI